MRVAIVSQSFCVSSGSGVFRAAGELARHLEANGIDVVRVEAPRLRDLVYYLSVPFLLSDVDAEVFHIFMPEYSLGLLNSKISARAVVTIHDCIPLRAPERHPVHTLWSRFTYHLSKRAKVMHVPSCTTASEVRGLLNIPIEKIYTIPWGVDVARFSTPRGVLSGRISVAGYLGGLGPRKNVDWILRLAKIFPEVKFRIGGKGPRIERLKKKVLALGLNNVEFVGFVSEDELPSFYSTLDVFLFPSQHEGYGFPVVEAIAAGVPYVIAGDTGIARRLPVIRVRSFSEFVRAFGEVVCGNADPIRNGPQLLINMGLDWGCVLNRFVRLYEKVLDIADA